MRKSYAVQYRRGKQTRRIKLDAGNALTAEQAKAAAKTILAKVALGEDPKAERIGRRDARQLRSVVDEFWPRNGEACGLPPIGRAGRSDRQRFPPRWTPP